MTIYLGDSKQTTIPINPSERAIKSRCSFSNAKMCLGNMRSLLLFCSGKEELANSLAENWAPVAEARGRENLLKLHK